MASFAIWAASMGTSTSPIERLNSVAGGIVSKKRLRMGKKKRAMSTKYCVNEKLLARAALRRAHEDITGWSSDNDESDFDLSDPEEDAGE